MSLNLHPGTEHIPQTETMPENLYESTEGWPAVTSELSAFRLYTNIFMQTTETVGKQRFVCGFYCYKHKSLSNCTLLNSLTLNQVTRSTS